MAKKFYAVQIGNDYSSDIGSTIKREALRIPYRTVEDWEKGARACPAYVAELIAYRVQRDPTFRNGQSTDQTIKAK